MKAIVLTGASGGIGESTTQVLVQAGYHVFGSVRKVEDAHRLQQQFGSTFHALQFDVTDEAAIQGAAQQVREQLQGETLTGLINNAGIFVPGPLLHVTPSDLRRQWEVNLTGVVMVTQAFAPLLGTDRSLRGIPGRVINIGSVLGKISMPFLGPYCASKFALEGLTDALRLELMLYGIAVSIIRPGPIYTTLHNKVKAILSSAFEKTDYAPLIAKAQLIYDEIHRGALPAEQVAQVMLKALTDRRLRPSYLVTNRPFEGWLLPMLMPKRVLQNGFAERFGLNPPSSKKE